MQSEAPEKRRHLNPTEIIGKAKVIRLIYEGGDVLPLWNDLIEKLVANHSDASAFYDLSIIMNSVGLKDKAAIAQKAALRRSKTYKLRAARGESSGLNVLVLVAEGDFMANTPIEFLLEESDITLLLHYIDADTSDLVDLPDHDVAFVAVAESTNNLPILHNLERLLMNWRGPIMNNTPRSIMGLSRDGICEKLLDAVAVVTPTIIRMPRGTLLDIAHGAVAVETVRSIEKYPFIVRPLDTHAGNGMEKIDDAAELFRFLETHPDPIFYIAPFIDYSSRDGKFRKQRIAFIDGKAYASHMAVSEHWMVHYLNAGMSIHAERRAEEAAWMASFDEDFYIRHGGAFAELCECLKLDYFAIDCAELPDGRLLVFEADVAMFVHCVDSPTLFPYKRQAMRKLFKAFEAAIERRALTSHYKDSGIALGADFR